MAMLKILLPILVWISITHCVKQARDLIGAEPLESCGRRPAIDLKITTRYNHVEGYAKIMASNGHRALSGSYPSYAYVTVSTQISGPPSYSQNTDCGGTLIGSRTVITAVHCLYSLKSLNDLTIELGRNGPSKRWLQKHKVARVCHSHKHCQTEINSGSHNMIPIDDFAILQLTNDVQYTDYIQPACISYNLNSYYKLAADDKEQVFDAVGMGWYNNWGDVPEDLLYIKMKRDCDEKVSHYYHNLHPSIDCFKAIREANLCQGDSGGPIYYYRYVNTSKGGEADRRQFVAGLTSFGRHDCRSVKYPVGFISVEYYEDKINSIVPDKQVDIISHVDQCYDKVLRNLTKPFTCSSIIINNKT